jgi:hypothetical protein
VPLTYGESPVGTLTFYSPAGSEIGIEQRVLIQAIAPTLAETLSSAINHDEIAAVDAGDQTDREVLYSVMDALLSSRARWPDKNDPERLMVVNVKWRSDATVPEHYKSMQTTLERAIAAATNSTGHVVRLAASEVLIAASQKHLVAAGLAPTALSRTRRATEIEVVEIANSLELREVLRLTSSKEQQPGSGKPLIH